MSTIDPQLISLQVRRTILMAELEAHMGSMKVLADMLMKEKLVVDGLFVRMEQVQQEIRPLTEEYLGTKKAGDQTGS